MIIEARLGNLVCTDKLSNELLFFLQSLSVRVLFQNSFLFVETSFQGTAVLFSAGPFGHPRKPTSLAVPRILRVPLVSFF